MKTDPTEEAETPSAEMIAPPGSGEAARAAPSDHRGLFSGRTLGLILSAAILFAVLAIRSQSFLTAYTMSVISRQVAFFAFIALAQAMCLVVGAMNLSVGAIGSIATKPSVA